jgi:hypothetical protein
MSERRDDLPEHVAAATEEAQAAWIAAYDASIYADGDEERARRAADDAMRAAGGGSAET